MTSPIASGRPPTLSERMPRIVEPMIGKDASEELMDLVVQRRVAAQHQAEHRDEDEQEGKQREEGVVGDKARELAACRR